MHSKDGETALTDLEMDFTSTGFIIVMPLCDATHCDIRNLFLHRTAM